MSSRKPGRIRRPSMVPQSSNWTLLTNHGHVLVLLSLNPELTVRDLAAKIGITERAASRIISELQNDGFIQVGKQGRRNTYRIDANKYFRHPIEEKCQIRSLITIIKQAEAST
jgi:predicted transcriptional regulator